MRDAPQRGFNATQHNRRIRKSFAAALRINDDGAIWAFAAFAISQIGLMIPITPGGLGTVDAAMIGILVALGVNNGNATAADLVWRASSYVPQIVIGILALVTWYRRAGKTFATAKTPPA
jgi:uncharacterized membrane protein YbhN (UPF0104 family)